MTTALNGADMGNLEVKWYGINALEFRYDGGAFMIDPYVSRDEKNLTVPAEVDRYLTTRPDFVLMTHAHWDHLPDMPRLIAKTDTVLYASETACWIMRALGVPEKNLHPLKFGEVLEFPGGMKITALESRHMGVIPEPSCYDAMPPAEALKSKGGWRCGEVFAFLIEYDNLRILNCGSANFHLPTMKGLECDYLICGISRWKEGFPELLANTIKYRILIPVHHDEFRLPLSEFYLRNDMERLQAALPGIQGKTLPVLEWTNL